MSVELMLKEPDEAQVRAVEEQIDGNWLPYLMDMQLSRNYLNSMQHPEQWEMSVSGLHEQFGWLQIDRLPMAGDDGTSLMFAWQSVLSACHTLGMKVAFVLRRVNGRTKIYFGGVPAGGGNVCNVLRQCVAVHLPGAVLQEQRTGFSMAEELDGVGVCSGMVTGIPSLQVSGERSWLQTLDKLARGISSGGSQKNYALVVIADPAKDAEISQLQQKLLGIKSEIHTMASYSESQGRQEGKSSGTSQNRHSGLAMVLGLAQTASAISLFTGNTLGYIGMTALTSMLGGIVGDKGKNSGENQSLTRSLSREHRDFTVGYCEKIIDKHIARLEGGRSTGFWPGGT